MTTVIFVSADGRSQHVDVLPGLTLMETAVQNGIEGIDGDCGGSCNCATCHVWVDAEWLAKLPPPEATEAGLVDCLANARPNSRLCCQIKISADMDGMVLHIPSAA